MVLLFCDVSGALLCLFFEPRFRDLLPITFVLGSLQDPEATKGRTCTVGFVSTTTCAASMFSPHVSCFVCCIVVCTEFKDCKELPSPLNGFYYTHFQQLSIVSK